MSSKHLKNSNKLKNDVVETKKAKTRLPKCQTIDYYYKQQTCIQEPRNGK